MTANERMLKISNLKLHYPIYSGLLRKQVGSIKAVDGISLSLHQQETLGIVGESGCGKTSLGKCIVRLEKPTEGEIHVRFPGGEMKEIFQVSHEESFNMRKRVQMVFQDPYSALNPVMTIQRAFDEPMKLHGILSASQRTDRIAALLESVNINSNYMHRYPNEFSGGQRQRICIARALCIEPELIVLDEPVSALDVSIQAQVLNLLKDLQQNMNLTYVFIAHDISVVEYMSDWIAVMYFGRIVETMNADRLYETMSHPYTQALLSAVPVPIRGRKRSRIILQGDVPSQNEPPSGCKFHTRCFKCQEICVHEEPELKPFGDDENHFVACHFAETIDSIKQGE